MFSFFITYAEMCSECEIDGSILPLIESFQMRLKLPKVNFIFYEYFFKPVVGDGNWKQHIAENKRLGTMYPKPLLMQSLKTTTLHGKDQNYFTNQTELKVMSYVETYQEATCRNSVEPYRQKKCRPV
jgi:hypothetical protein